MSDLAEDLKAGQSVAIKGFVLASSWGSLSHGTVEMPQHGYVTICPYTIAFQVPEDFDLVACKVASLKAQIEQVSDDYWAKVKELKGNLQSLLAIESGASAVTEALEEEVEPADSSVEPEDDVRFDYPDAEELF